VTPMTKRLVAKRRVAVVTLVVVATAIGGACTFPTKALPSGDFTCFGQPDPQSAPATLTIAGQTFDEESDEAVADATVEAFLDNGDGTEPVSIFTVTSDGSGNFGSAFQTGMIARSAYLQASATNYLTTELFPAAPVSTNIQVALAMFTMDDLVALGSATQQTLDPSLVQAIVLATDCSGNFVAGAQVTTTPPAGKIVYAGMNHAPALSQTATDDTGLVFILNLPTGTVTIGGSIDGTPVPSHQVTTTTGQVLVSFIQP
jgi:hypothetical protein